MASVRFLKRAEADLEDAVAWYESQSVAVARRFEAAVTAGIERITAMPELSTLVDDRHRLCPVRKSQYLLVYRYEKDMDEIVIVAVAHEAQGPRPWASGS
jgi:plasmid stabilization system protein ParE